MNDYELCPTCGAYWDCGHPKTRAELIEQLVDKGGRAAEEMIERGDSASWVDLELFEDTGGKP